MFSLLKKIIIFIAIFLGAFAIINPSGFASFRERLAHFIPHPSSSVEEINTKSESQNIKQDPWSNADADVPENFDSGYMPDGTLKTSIKKLNNSIGKDEYGYKK
jgi:hypothetical protein